MIELQSDLLSTIFIILSLDRLLNLLTLIQKQCLADRPMIYYYICLINKPWNIKMCLINSSKSGQFHEIFQIISIFLSA